MGNRAKRRSAGDNHESVDLDKILEPMRIEITKINRWLDEQINGKKKSRSKEKRKK